MTVRFSIISPCLNALPYLAEALLSVRAQRRADVEHIVVDGGSGDGTLEALAACPDLTLLRAPGSSIYEALNVGLERAAGEIVGLLNVDDCYQDGAFTAIDAAFRATGAAAVCGSADLLPGSGVGPARARLRQEGDLMTRAMLGDPCINAWFFDAQTLRRLGRFDARYRIAGDRELLLRLLLSGLSVHELPRVVYRYRPHTASATFGGTPALWRRTLAEHNLMTSTLLAQPGLPPRARQQLRAARTRDNVTGALYAARSRDVSGFFAHVRAGMRHDTCWPARLAAGAWRAATDRRRPDRTPSP